MRSEEGAVEATIVMSAFLTLMLGMIEFAQALLDLEHDDARGSRRADATRWSTMRRPAQRVPASSCSASPATLANCAVAKGKCCLGGLSVAERHRQLHRGSCQLHCCCEAVANEPWSCRSSLQSVTCNGGGLSISGGREMPSIPAPKAFSRRIGVIPEPRTPWRPCGRDAQVPGSRLRPRPTREGYDRATG
jgi:hypothetical protein